MAVPTEIPELAALKEALQSHAAVPGSTENAARFLFLPQESPGKGPDPA